LDQLNRGLRVVFANEDEIRALFQTSAKTESDYADLARKLAALGAIACVKMGKEGAWIASGGELHRIKPVLAGKVVDTTGAGDAWAAGFLYGYLKNWPLPACGALGSLLGSETVQHIGPAISEERWADLRAAAQKIAAQ